VEDKSFPDLYKIHIHNKMHKAYP